MGDRDVLQVPRQVYRLRVFGLALGFVCVGAVFYERHAAGAAWGLLALHAFIWPHVAWQRARRSADPHRAERQHLLVDSGFGGVVVSLMEFALLPSVLIIAMLSMDKIGWGARFLLRASLTMASGLVVTALATGARFDPGTSMAMIAASLPLMVAYPIAVASVADRSGRLARERRKAIEQTVAMREQLAHTARVGTLGEMAAGLAHELNQPLTAIHLEASTALELDTAGDRAAVRDCLARVGEQSLRAGDIVRRMRSFARRVRSSRERADVADLIREVLGLLDHELRLANVETRLEVQPPIPMVTVDRIEIQQVLVNLIRNAMEAMTPAVCISQASDHSCRVRQRRRARFSVRHRSRYRPVDPRPAVSSLSKHEARWARPGAVDLRNADRGTWRTHRRRAGGSRKRRHLLFRAEMTELTPPVFVIDDEAPVRAGLSRLLNAIGVPNVTFESAESFLAAYEPEQQGCLLVDIRMPGMSGLDLIEELSRRRIALPAIVMTGHADVNSMDRLRALTTVGCLEKPFRVSQLKEILGRWWSTLDRGDPPWRL